LNQIESFGTAVVMQAKLPFDSFWFVVSSTPSKHFPWLIFSAALAGNLHRQINDVGKIFVSNRL
jgi:hypothetical protein